jgi:hypothetical protein
VPSRVNPGANATLPSTRSRSAPRASSTRVAWT